VALRYFASDYAAAAAAFRALAERYGARTLHQVHPTHRDTGGGELAVDFAWFGPADAPRVLLFTLGCHGPEGFTGSAVIRQWLENRQGRLPEGQALLAVHAVNPYGFAHQTRTTENNVDINRNFLDFATTTLRPNPVYDELHPALCPDDWVSETIAAGRTAIERANERHGVPAVTDALARGQYEHADGLFYGGRGPEWSNATLRAGLARLLPPGRDVVAIDLHTGLGPYGLPYFLCFQPPDSEGWERICRAYGDGVREAHRHYQGGRRPDFTGLLIDALGRMVPHRRYAGLVIEFGTRAHNQVKDALRLDRWLKFGRGRTESDRASLTRQVMEDFCPTNPDWRRSVLAHSDALLEKALVL
jgi:hypothetical protein